MNMTNWDGATGGWGNASDWPNGVPTALSEAVFAGAGSYQVTVKTTAKANAGAVELDASGATLAIQGVMNLGGTFDLKSGTLSLGTAGAAGVINGGTLVMDGGALTAQYGELKNMHVSGELDLSGTNEFLTVVGGLTATAVGGGVGLITLSGQNALLKFEGTQTFDNATIELAPSSLIEGDTVGGVNLTLGPRATIDSDSSGPSWITATKLTNEGTIGATTGQLNIESRVLVNEGSITDGAGLLIAARFTNGGAGVIDVAGSANIDGLIENMGTINIESGAILELRGRTTTAGLGDINNSGIMVIGGDLLNQGAVMTLGAGPLAGDTYINATVEGGVIVVGNLERELQSATLDDVTFWGPLDIVGQGGSLKITNGLNVTGADGTGAGSIIVDGLAQKLDFFGSTVLDNAVVDIGNGAFEAGDAISESALGRGHAATLTLGSGLSVVSSDPAAFAILTGGASRLVTIINDGMISASAAGGAFWFYGRNLINNGLIAVSNGDVLTVNTDKNALSGTGKITIATGGVVDIGAVAASQGIAFLDSAGTLKLTDAIGTAATVSGAVVGDRIDLVDTAATSATVNSNDQLVIANNGATVATLQLAGDYSATLFSVAGDGAGGALITLANAPSVQGMAHAMAGLAPTAAAGSPPGPGLTHAPTQTLALPHI
jgi:autotransporter family porin